MWKKTKVGMFALVPGMNVWGVIKRIDKTLGNQMFVVRLPNGSSTFVWDLTIVRDVIGPEDMLWPEETIDGERVTAG